LLWTLLTSLALVGIAAFFFPAFVIRPFSYQNPRALWWAMAVRDRAPVISLFAALACLLAATLLWRSCGKWRKGLMVIVLLVVTFSAVMSRLNYFEWMFHPVDAPRFESIAATKLDAGEMILAVRFGTDARAYPIRQMAYHHVLNDVVAGTPVAVTY
jgi:hypothetical protein